MDSTVNKSILVVDEDPEVLTLLTLLFEQEGVRVLRSRTRSEAFEVLSRNYVPVDLVVANMLIDRPGSDFSREVARVRPGVSVLLMSSLVDEEVIRVEVMKRCGLEENWIPDDRGVLEAVMSALVKTRSRATAR
jgi:DNA-binding response OmpR family regulator